MNKPRKALCTIVLIILNIGVFLILSMMGNTEESAFMLEYGAMYRPYIVEGLQYYRLFTSLFLHFGISHLLNNMVFLGALGWNVELKTGKIRFVLIYFISGLGGNLFSLWLNTGADGMAVSAGASGAVFGIMGALLCVSLKNHGRVGRLTNRQILLMVALGLYFGFTSSEIDNAAHIGGLVCGFAATAVLYRRRTKTPISEA